MRHRKATAKLGRTSSHRKAMIANMLKSLILHERITTTLAKAKLVQSYADKIVTLAKSGSLSDRRDAVARLQIRYNFLTPKEKRAAKEGNKEAYNGDRLVIDKLFATLGPRFATRQGGYTRLIKSQFRAGDRAEECVIEYLSE